MVKVPSKDELLEWLRDNPGAASKRDISRAFGLKGAERVELKFLLRELQDEGHIERRRGSVRPAGALPPVAILVVREIDSDGDVFAEPDDWDETFGDAPRILLLHGKSDRAPGKGDRVLAKVRAVRADGHAYEGRAIKKLDEGAARTLGVLRLGSDGARMIPVDKRAHREWLIPRGQTGDADDGELVEVEALEATRMGLPRGRVVATYGDPGAPRQVSLIAMVQNQIAYTFETDVLEEAEAARPVEELGQREDLRDLPLITIDPADARDHDDAVCAMADEDPANPDGHIVWVAIADVAHYVTSGSKLDLEARRRGNSTYFPDRVSPMLPESLSADLCSLHEGVERPCMAVRMVLDAAGNKIGHRFTRGMMRSPAALAYEQVQAAMDGEGTLPGALLRDVIEPLFAAYHAAAKARDRRQPLEFDLPERQIKLNDDGQVEAIAFRERLDAHRLIEEFMILANVCAAETLEAKRTGVLYRVHEEPNPDKLEALRETVQSLGLSLAKGQVLKTRHFNQLLAAAHGTEAAETVAMSVLRTQTQAYYAPENLGHFGLSLARYAHFTSPIRRYADLIVHRALITALKLGSDGLTPADRDILAETGQHISETERRSMTAERETIDRYVAAFMADRVGAEFSAVISGVAKAGAFVRLDETGADGLVPISTLGTDYFHHDRDANTLTGERTGRVVGLGMRATVRLVEATAVTGGMIFELLGVEGKAMAPSRRRGGPQKPRRKVARGRVKRIKAARKKQK